MKKCPKIIRWLLQTTSMLQVDDSRSSRDDILGRVTTQMAKIVVLLYDAEEGRSISSSELDDDSIPADLLLILVCSSTKSYSFSSIELSTSL